MDVADWLRSLGLERYEAAFRENAVDTDLLPNLTTDDLRILASLWSAIAAVSWRQFAGLRSEVRRLLIPLGLSTDPSRNPSTRQPNAAPSA